MKIVETDGKEYNRIATNLEKNQLEISGDDPIPEELITCWKLVDDNKPAEVSHDDYLVGGCILCMREGEYVIDGIAVDPEYREGDWGSKMLEVAMDETRKRGGHLMYLVARAPGFFRKHGFEAVERENAPEFFECFTCDQYNKTCHPEVMKRVI